MLGVIIIKFQRTLFSTFYDRRVVVLIMKLWSQVSLLIRVQVFYFELISGKERRQIPH